MGKLADRVRKMAEADEAQDDISEAPPGEAQAERVAMPSLPLPLTIPEKRYLLAVERGDVNSVKKMLQKAARHPKYMNKNCVDPMGRGALLMSIDNENLEMVELLVVMGVETQDSLLHAINVEFVEAVEVLLEHEELVHKDGEPYSWEVVDRQTASFTPEITPLTLAAHRNNYEILKILIDRGAALPMPHDIRCGCEACLKSTAEDSLGHSMSRINAYRALASPSLIALSSTDPIITAFELSAELKRLSYEESEFSKEYKDLRTQCRGFAEELLSHSRCSTELAVILNYDPEAPPYEDGDTMKLHRLEQAIDFKQKSFVSHPNVQQLMGALWYAGLPGFRRLSTSRKLLTIAKINLLFPVYCMQYMLFPDSPTSKWIKSPFMKFLLHSASYLFFLLLLILVSVRFEELFIIYLGTDGMRERLYEALKRPRGHGPSPLELLITLYVFGFIWEEIHEMRKDGIKKYARDMWNVLDVLRDTLYIVTMVLRIIAYIQQVVQINENPRTAFIPREEWHSYDPQLISEGLFAAANVLSALKLIHIFSINPYLGPLQISLGRMVMDIIKFFFIYVLVLFAFACGLTQLLWYFNDLEKQKCYSLPGGLPDWTKNGDACMKWRRFHNLFEASQSLFWAGFGMIGLDDFELTGAGGYTRFWSMFMFGAYSIINIIVLLNLLIAMMSSSYAFIVDHADTEWKFARTKLWMSYFDERSTLPPPFNILPTTKKFQKLFQFTKGRKISKKWSSRAFRRARKACDYRYLSVMRALIWRYVCAMQQKSIERAVTEDDVNEVKGDISALRYELIDLFQANGLDTSKCEVKSRAALGRKMRMWERRLMRDFHVAPAMGTEEAEQHVAKEVPETAAEQFRRIAKLAMVTNLSDDALTSGPQTGGNQIGFRRHKDDSYSKLKYAMERARLKLAQATPETSPGSSRGASPIPELYTGPNLLEAIKNLELSPLHSTNQSPTHSTGSTPKGLIDGQASDPSKLTVPGRRAERSLKSAEQLEDDHSADRSQSNYKLSKKILSGFKRSDSTETSKSSSSEPDDVEKIGYQDTDGNPDIIIKPASPIPLKRLENYGLTNVSYGTETPDIYVKAPTPMPDNTIDEMNNAFIEDETRDQFPFEDDDRGPIVSISSLSSHQNASEIQKSDTVSSLKSMFESKNSISASDLQLSPSKTLEKNGFNDTYPRTPAPGNSPVRISPTRGKRSEPNEFVLNAELLLSALKKTPTPPPSSHGSDVSVTIEAGENQNEAEEEPRIPLERRPDHPVSILIPEIGVIDSEMNDDDFYL